MNRIMEKALRAFPFDRLDLPVLSMLGVGLFYLDLPKIASIPLWILACGGILAGSIRIRRMRLILEDRQAEKVGIAMVDRRRAERLGRRS